MTAPALPVAALAVLRRAVRAPVPANDVAPELLADLRRKRLVVVERLPTPWTPANHGKKAPHVLATLAGAQRVQELAQ